MFMSLMTCIYGHNMMHCSTAASDQACLSYRTFVFAHRKSIRSYYKKKRYAKFITFGDAQSRAIYFP